MQLSDITHSLTEKEVKWVAEHSNGFTGADLRLLLTEASLQVLDDFFATKRPEKVTM